MNKIFKASLCLVTISLIGGCAGLSIGEDESCGIVPKGATCVSAKDVYLMTNHRENLENMSPEELEALREKATGKKSKIYESSNEKPTLSEFFGIGTTREPANGSIKAEQRPMLNTNEVVSNDGLKNAKEIKLSEMLIDEQSVYRTPAKMLRMQFAKWEDQSGRLHDPGKIYVEIEGRKWITGRQQVTNPKIITPLEVKRAVAKKTKNATAK